MLRLTITQEHLQGERVMRRILFAMLALVGLASTANASALNAPLNTNAAINGMASAAVDTAALDLSGVILAE